MSAKDVVKRLRGGSPYELTNKLMQEAADRIEHLERVNARLRREVLRLSAEVKG